MSHTLALFSRPAANSFFPLPRVSASSLEDAHRQLAREHLRCERFRLARRHFRIALRFDPKNASLHYGLAEAWEKDPHGSDEHAYRSYRRAVKLDRTRAIYFAALARSALRIGREGVARAAMAKAVHLAPVNPDVLQTVVEACREAGWLERAATIVCAARFQSPQCRRIRALWDRVRYDRAAAQNDVSSDTKIHNVIPFLRLEQGPI